MKSFYSGILGGILVTVVFIVIILCCNIFNYHVEIINPKISISSDYKTDKIQILNEMEKKGILLTPQEYTNNVISYYNTALFILSAMLVLFSAVSYFHLKFLSEEQLLSRLKSKEFETTILSAIFGKVEEQFSKLEDIEELNNQLRLVIDRIEQIENHKNEELEITEQNNGSQR